MSLRWDPVLTRHLAEELNRTLEGARLRAVRLDGAARELTLFFRERTLRWHLHPGRGALLLLSAAEPAGADLRVTGRVRRIASPPDERIVRFELLPTRKGRRAIDLVVELLGNQWNAIVTEGPEAYIRHVLVRRAGARELAVGGAYEAPPPSPREGRGEPIGRERWHELLDPVLPEARATALVRSVAWTSPITSSALVDDLDAGYEAWLRMAHPDDTPEPGLLTDGGRAQPYPFPVPGASWTPTPTLIEAFRLADAEADHAAGVAASALLPPELVRSLERALDAARRRLTSLEAEHSGLEDPEALRATADLLLARLSEVPRGSGSASLEDFDGNTVTVPLDPTLAPNENAEAYYERAAKAERARERIPGLVEEARATLAELEELERRVRDGEVDAEALGRALPEDSGRSGGGARPAAPLLPYHRFVSSGGLEIRVGRGSRHNDDLTFHHAAPDDVWLHAQQSPGAHVILRWGRREPPPARDLAEAAVLAALNSRARGSGSVPVAWTFRKYVRKPRGSSPGSVVPERVKTLFVEPDPRVAERLAQG